MEINADFSKRVVMHGAELEWKDSPMPGVRRRMLDRIGVESGHATTIVSYDPGSRFSPHTHPGGEEFIVLEGVFQDEHGDFPVGSYLRNPPQSEHTPASEPGCVIFVKLWQFDPEDRTHIRTHIDKVGNFPDAARPGVEITPLYQDSREWVRLEEWSAGAEIPLDTSGGMEILVLEGSFQEAGDSLQTLSWLRLPVDEPSTALVGPTGAQVWVKSGHLPFLGAQ